MPWPIFWRIFWRVALFALVGALVVGPISALLMALYIFPSRPLEAAVFGVFYGAFCLGLSGFITAKRRDTSEELKMAMGGAWLGIVNCFLLGTATLCIAIFFLRSTKYLGAIFSLLTLMGALLGSLYTAIHPKYRSREEPLLLFEETKDNIEYSNRTGNELR